MLKIPCKVWNSKKFPANFVTKLWRIYMPNSKLYGQHHKFYLKIRWVILGLNMGILEKWKKAARYGYKHPSCQILNPSQCSVMAKHWQTKVYACMILFRLPHCNWKKITEVGIHFQKPKDCFSWKCWCTHSRKSLTPFLFIYSKVIT